MDDAQIELVRAALRRAYSFGQTYWADADSESYAANRRSDETARKFSALVEETCAALAAAPTPQADTTEPDDAAGPISEGWQISVASGHSGYGVYAHMTDYPEEGAVLVLPIELAVMPAPTPQAKEPRELVQEWASTRHVRFVNRSSGVFSTDTVGLESLCALVEMARATAPEQADAIPVAELFALLPYAYYMDPPDGGDVPVVEQLRRMSRDAARYRWLRDNCNDKDSAATRIVTHHWGLEWDAAIDAAMKEPT